MSEQLKISRTTDALWVQRKVMDFAASLGFSRTAQWEVAIAVTELVTNAIKFATRGHVSFAACDRDGATGLEVQVEDDGPGIADVESAIEDGFSEGRFFTPEDAPPPALRRGMGAGLGAVKRLMDDLEVENLDGRGLRVTARKWR